MVKISNNVKMKKWIYLKIEKSLNGSSYTDWIMRINSFWSSSDKIHRYSPVYRGISIQRTTVSLNKGRLRRQYRMHLDVLSHIANVLPTIIERWGIGN